MMRQYLSFKEKHPDAILFFRMGDFYEMFFSDAELAARELGLTLTTRDKNKPNPIPSRASVTSASLYEPPARWNSRNPKTRKSIPSPQTMIDRTGRSRR